MSMFDAAVAGLLLEAAGALEGAASSLDICSDLGEQGIVGEQTSSAVAALRRDLAWIREDLAVAVQRLTDDEGVGFTVPRPSASAVASTTTR